MNKHFYRIVFNKARGMLMVVAEIVKRHQGEGRSSQKATEHDALSAKVSARMALNPITVMTYLVLGWVSLVQPSYATTIVVDNNADKTQRPTVTQTSNGVTQVNIQTPTSGGVSHNKYTQFDVSDKGVILNNSYGASKTELAGYVKGNEFLVGSNGAKIILNEINSKNASQLAGYIEVAGQKAQVIIANAAGITCNGCGFINADRATLTTGKPIMENGQLLGYQVDQGNIAINGKGLDSSRQNYTDLIARSVSINSSLWGNEVSVIAGKNRVSRDLKQIDKLTSNDAESNKPQLAIDVAALGGMYAGKIQMVGTESGVGVNNAGNLGASAGSITITADGKIVNTGAIQANQDIQLTSKQNIDNQKQIYAKGNIQLTSNQSINNSGTLVAQNNLSIKADENVKNSQQATIAAGIDEQGNLTQAGSLTVQAKSASLNGKQLSTDKLTIETTSTLDLSGSQNKAGSLAIQSGELNTQNAVVTVDDNADIEAQNWHNQRSSLQINGALTVKANHITNTDATLYTDKLDIKATSLSGDGKLLAESALNIDVNDAFLNQSKILSNGDTVIHSNTSIENKGDILSAKNLHLTSDQIVNNETSTIESDNLNITGKNLTNTGLINGGEVKLSLTNDLNNLDTGRIYGDNIDIIAENLNNKAAQTISPIIAARGQLTATVNTFNNLNHATFLSLGDMRIDATTINNHSSKIESVGNMLLNADTINNINDKIVVEEVLVDSQNVVEYSPSGSSTRYGADEVNAYRTSSNHNYLTLASLDGLFNSTYQFYQYNYQANTYETQIVETNPGEIIAGKNLTINANHVKNDNSQIIAGNALNINSADIENISLKGEHRVENIGTITYYDRKKRKKVPGQSRKWKQTTSTSAYNDIVKTEIDVGNSKILDYTATQATSVDIKDKGNNPVDAGSVGIIEPNTKLPNNSLYTINKDVNKNYLIETDSKFTNKKEWLSSDYMFEQLKADPNNIQKRLGDGYYEQQLIKEQIIALTGQRYLGDYSNDVEQYMALMNAGVEFANNYGLVIGVALSSEQMQALTSDIVWMVSKTVIVDGQAVEVLVPQVYVVNRPQVTTSGALLAGNGVSIKASGDIESSGSILSKNSLNILANNVNNNGVMMGDKLDIKAIDSITSHGSLMADNGLSLAANNNINLISTTSTNSTQYGNNSTSNTVVNNVSSVQTKQGGITIAAGNDVNLEAALIVNHSDSDKTVISAGNNINLATVTTNNQENTIWGSDNYRKLDKDSVVGTQIISGGDVELKAGNDITIKSGNISTDNALNLNAGHNVDITSSTEHETLTDHQKVTSKGLASKSTVTTHTEKDNKTEQGSSLSGDTVNIQAGNDLGLTGSQVVSKGDMALSAGNNVDINAAEESYYTHEQTIKTKSGLMGSGGLGVTIGKEKEDLKQTNTEQGYLASTIGSTEGNVNITAGKNLGIQGSDVIAKQDINLQGENVTIVANDSKVTYKEEYKYEKTGLTVAVTGTVADLYDANKAIDNARKNGNDTLTALQAIKGGLTGANAGLDIYGAATGSSSSEASIGVNASFGSEKTERKVNQEQHNVVGSGVSAENNINIKATGNDKKDGGDINVIGSEVRAGNDINLDASRDVNVIGAVNTQHRDSDEKSSSSSVGVGVVIGAQGNGIQFNGNTSFSHERENADGSAWSQGIVDAGNHLNVNTGNNANVVGGQLKGDSVKVDVGNDLTIKSLQDTDNYDYEKLSSSVGGSYTTGGTGPQFNASNSKTDMDSKWASVTDQSGIYAGKGGFDVTVGGNTDLTGAVIASSAEDKSKNKLDTGTISFEDIENKADFNVDHVSINTSVGGSLEYIPTPGAPSIYHNDGSDSSTTKSAVEDGTLIVRDTDKQTQDVNDLSRDTANANDALGQIFDKQKEQDRMDALDLVKDITAQAKDVAQKYSQIKAEETYKGLSESDKAAKDAEAIKALERQGLAVNEDSIKTQVIHDIVQNQGVGNMGDSFSKGLDAASSIISGIITGDITGGLAGASAPYLAEQIKLATGHKDPISGEWKTDDNEANLIAHAILGGAVAAAQGNSALAGGAGALTGEAAANYIKDVLYGENTKIEDLTQEQKENISNLAQIASGLAVAAGGGSVSDVGTAVAGGKNAVENNALAKLALEGCAIAAPCRSAVAKKVLEYGVKAGITVVVAKEIADNISSEDLDHLITLNMMGNDEVTNRYLGYLSDKYTTNVQSSDNSQKEDNNNQLAGTGSIAVGGAPGLPPDDDHNNNQEKDKSSTSEDKSQTTSNGYKVSNGSDKVIDKADLENPIVQSRINIQNGDSKAGWNHVLQRHFSGNSNASQFTIAEEEAKTIIGSNQVRNVPISNTRISIVKETGQQQKLYERVITLDKNIGVDKFTGKPTNTMTILTDKAGNLITATPGRMPL